MTIAAKAAHNSGEQAVGPASSRTKQQRLLSSNTNEQEATAENAAPHIILRLQAATRSVLLLLLLAALWFKSVLAFARRIYREKPPVAAATGDNS